MLKACPLFTSIWGAGEGRESTLEHLSRKKKLLIVVPTNSKQIITHKMSFSCTKALSRLLPVTWKPNSEIRAEIETEMEHHFPWKNVHFQSTLRNGRSKVKISTG